jgi:hypothetical protein
MIPWPILKCGRCTTFLRDGYPGRDDNAALRYLAVASACYAVVQYDKDTARLVRRVVGLFGDVPSAELYAIENGYRLYDLSCQPRQWCPSRRSCHQRRNRLWCTPRSAEPVPVPLRHPEPV